MELKSLSLKAAGISYCIGLGLHHVGGLHLRGINEPVGACKSMKKGYLASQLLTNAL
jgi:hypothetical protein